MPHIGPSSSEVLPSGYEMSLPQCKGARREVSLIVSLLSAYGSRAPSDRCGVHQWSLIFLHHSYDFNVQRAPYVMQSRVHGEYAP